MCVLYGFALYFDQRHTGVSAIAIIIFIMCFMVISINSYKSIFCYFVLIYVMELVKSC